MGCSWLGFMVGPVVSLLAGNCASVKCFQVSLFCVQSADTLSPGPAWLPRALSKSVVALRLAALLSGKWVKSKSHLVLGGWLVAVMTLSELAQS